MRAFLNKWFLEIVIACFVVAIAGTVAAYQYTAPKWQREHSKTITIDMGLSSFGGPKLIVLTVTRNN